MRLVNLNGVGWVQPEEVWSVAATRNPLATDAFGSTGRKPYAAVVRCRADSIQHECETFDEARALSEQWVRQLNAALDGSGMIAACNSPSSAAAGN